MAYSSPKFEVAIKVRQDKTQYVCFWAFGESRFLDLETVDDVNTLIRLLENARDTARFRESEPAK